MDLAQQGGLRGAPDWTLARAEMLLDPAVTYLNSSAFGALSRPVFERSTQLRARLAAQPSDFMLREVPGLLWRSRARLAGYLGGDPHRLMFATNVSAALGTVASSLAAAGAGEILMTDQEYSTARWCWERAAARHGLTIRTFKLPAAAQFDPDLVVERAAAAMSMHTRVLFFSHILSTTGAILPAGRLCALARARGIASVVDGAHGPGFVDLALDEVGCDFYVSCGHKWMLMPSGSGFLYLGRENEERLEPTTVSWAYHRPDTHPWDERDQFGSTPRLRRFECEGTRDICPWLLAPEAIDFQERFGHAQIRDRMRELSAYANARLRDLGIEAATPRTEGQSGGIAAFFLPESSHPNALRQALWDDAKVEVSVGTHAGRSILRVSTHFYNSKADIDCLAAALTRCLNRQSGGI